MAIPRRLALATASRSWKCTERASSPLGRRRTVPLVSTPSTSRTISRILPCVIQGGAGVSLAGVLVLLPHGEALPPWVRCLLDSRDRTVPFRRKKAAPCPPTWKPSRGRHAGARRQHNRSASKPAEAFGAAVTDNRSCPEGGVVAPMCPLPAPSTFCRDFAGRATPIVRNPPRDERGGDRLHRRHRTHAARARWVVDAQQHLNNRTPSEPGMQGRDERRRCRAHDRRHIPRAERTAPQRRTLEPPSRSHRRRY